MVIIEYPVFVPDLVVTGEVVWEVLRGRPVGNEPI